MPFGTRRQIQSDQPEKADQLPHSEFEQVPPFETGNCGNADPRMPRGILLR